MPAHVIRQLHLGDVFGGCRLRRLEILATGKVYGDITVGSLISDEGGILRGMVLGDKTPSITTQSSFKSVAA